MSETSPVAIVTGASAGIGLAVTERLVAAGYRVVMIARTEGPLQREAARLGERATPWRLDIGDLAAVEALPAEVVQRLGRLDVVVNNAALHHRGPMMDYTPAQLAEMVQVNLASPMVLTRAAAPLLPDGGAIINVASLAGMVPLPTAATYSATKAGMRFFARAVAVELPRLRISTVSPGPVDTGFLADVENVADISLSQPMSTAGQIADSVMACLSAPSREIAQPWFSGLLATVGYLSPTLHRWLLPVMQRRGARNKVAYRAALEARARQGEA